MSKPIVLGASIGYKRTPIGRKVLLAPARIKVWKAGRRGSKTFTEADFLASNALRDHRRQKHWYVTTTLALGREEFFPVLLDLLPRDFIARVNDSQLWVKLTNGASIWCKSAEKEKNLRGRGLGSAVLDEAAFLRSGIWDQIIRPQLAGSEGPALIASSPKKGWFTQLYHRIIRENLANHAAFHSTIYDNPHISREEIEQIRTTTPINTWLQEYMAEEISETGQVYDEFQGGNVFDPRERFLDFREFVTLRGLDWGTDDPTGAIWVGISPEGYLVVTEEHEQANWDPTRQAEVILSKSSAYSKIQATVLDRTAFRKESDLTSVADQFRDCGIPCQQSERDVASSIGIVKRFLRGDGATPWLYVSAKCSRLITAIQEWEHGDHEPDIAAAFRYAVTWAVTHRMTRLADAVPTLKSVQKPVSEEEAKYILASQARMVPARKRHSWGLNFDYGVPL